MDPRTPVVVGGGQWSNRVDRGADPVEPVDLIAEALRQAAADAGGRAGATLLAAADAVWIVQMLSWRYADPGRLVAQRIGAQPRDTAVSPIGGDEPQTLVSQACQAIAAGEADVVLIGGAEAWRSRRSPGGKALGWTVEPTGPGGTSPPPGRPTGPQAPLNHPAETAHGIVLPVQLYPLFEQALRHTVGRSVANHMKQVSELWAGFSQVAAANPHAWIREPMTAEEIRTASAANRWVGWPYTKTMNANNAVEQGAGLIVTSAGKAAALGVPRDRWVFPLASTDAHDHYAVSHRADLASSPAIRTAGRTLFELAGLGADDVAHVDLYSCFPSAVQIAATELGLTPSPDRNLTVTGGLSFAGGPWNNYVTHAIVTMLRLLRAEPGSVGLVTANGGYLTKHALGLYSTEPPPGGFRWASTQEEVDALPRREVREPSEGGEPEAGEHTGEIESWVVMHDRDNQPEQAIAAVLLDEDGRTEPQQRRRAWATSTEPSILKELTSGSEHIGRQIRMNRGQLVL